MTTALTASQSLDSCLSEPNLAISLLRTLCATDPAAWCLLTAGQTQITQCSHAFLQLWGLEPPQPVRSSEGRMTSWAAVQAAMIGFGVDIRFLQDIAEGRGGPGDGSLCLHRNDLLTVRVEWTVVPAYGTFRGGWLVRCLPEREAEYVDQVVRTITQAQQKLAQLSVREREVLKLLFEGSTNKAIAFAMEISQKTVEKHRARIMQKLKVPNTAQLFRLLSYATLAEGGPGIPEAL